MRAARGPGKGGGTPVPLLVGGAMLVFATPSVVLAGILLLPTLMSLLADSTQGRPVARAVLLFGIAASCPTLAALWRTGDRMEDAVALGTEISTLAICWAAQAGGWLLTQILPLVISAVMEAKSRVEAARLERRRADCLQEWS